MVRAFEYFDSDVIAFAVVLCMLKDRVFVEWGTHAPAAG